MKILLFITLIVDILLAQNRLNPIEIKDTTFTTAISYEKCKEKYPFIIPVQIDKYSKIEHNEYCYVKYGSREVKLDLFTNSLKDCVNPLIIMVFGGGWKSGSKEMDWPMAQTLAEKGYIVATVEYRLSNEAIYPAAVCDIKAAIKWLKNNSYKFNIDTNKIAILGESAGGQLAALVGTTNNFLKYEMHLKNVKASCKVQAIIDIDGVLDMTTPYESGKDTNIANPSAGKLWLSYSYNENPNIWKEASAISHTDKNSPPFLFVNSSIPRFHAGRDEVISILQKNDIYSEVHTILETPHPFWLFHPWFDQTVEYIDKFLKKVF